MSLIERIISSVAGDSLNTAPNALARVQLAMNLIRRYPGGVEGILNKLTDAGLGRQVQSWIGTGRNEPINGDDVLRALGSAAVEQVAKPLGLDPMQAAADLAEALPDVIDGLTTGGRLDPDAAASRLGELEAKLPPT